MGFVCFLLPSLARELLPGAAVKRRKGYAPGKSNARKTGERVEFPNERVRLAFFVGPILLDTHRHRGYTSWHERSFRLRSRVCYRHCVGDAFYDGAGGHGLGGAPRLAESCRN